MNKYLFTSEAVSEGHPDKVADQISDAILDAYLVQDSKAHVAVETLVTTQIVVISGEVLANPAVRVNHQKVVRETIEKIGYTDPQLRFSANEVTVIDFIHEQSTDICMGVRRTKEEEQGAGDQGMMFGYATNETAEYMPATLVIANAIVKALASIRKGGLLMKYLRPDSKAQVTAIYEDGKPVRVTDIVVSTQHDDFAAMSVMHENIEYDIKNIIMPKVLYNLDPETAKLIDDNVKYHVNPTGNFVIGGPNGDTGLTGRKIIVDTYGGKGAHGGGAFSGKDPSKVDRSAAYMARYVAKNIVASGLCDECLIQLAYVIGESEPVSINVNTYGTIHKDGVTDKDIADFISYSFSLSPASIADKLTLRSQKYLPTAAYGHFGRTPEAETFSWEKLDAVDDVKSYFALNE